MKTALIMLVTAILVGWLAGYAITSMIDMTIDNITEKIEKSN